MSLSAATVAHLTRATIALPLALDAGSYDRATVALSATLDTLHAVGLLDLEDGRATVLAALSAAADDDVVRTHDAYTGFVRAFLLLRLG